jgi:hypothetical protein
MKKFIRWYKARILDWPYYRVLYQDGKRTVLIYRREAIGLRDVFKGEMYIDYETTRW